MTIHPATKIILVSFSSLLLLSAGPLGGQSGSPNEGPPSRSSDQEDRWQEASLPLASDESEIVFDWSQYRYDAGFWDDYTWQDEFDYEPMAPEVGYTPDPPEERGADIISEAWQEDSVAGEESFAGSPVMTPDRTSTREAGTERSEDGRQQDDRNRGAPPRRTAGQGDEQQTATATNQRNQGSPAPGSSGDDGEGPSGRGSVHTSGR